MKRIRKITLAIFLAVVTLSLASCVQNTVNYSLNLTADKDLALPGEVVNFKTEIIGDQVKEEISYEITAGGSYATINKDGALTVKEDALAKAKIIVVSKTKDRTSNEVTITVGTKLDSIVATANKTEIIPGQSAELTAELNPADANTPAVKWEVLKGSATINGNLVVVAEDAEVDSVVEVQAVSGNIKSNVLSFTVISGKSDKLLLSLSSNSVVVDKYSNTASFLEATIYDVDYNEVEDQIIDYEVIEGSEYLAVTSENNICYFEAKGHGMAKVRATIRGTSYTAEADVEVIVPPTALKFHDVFTERVGYTYNYSKADKLKFSVEVLGTNVCQDFKVIFADSFGKMGDEIGTYDAATGEITFNTTGRVNVIVTSDSGSKKETSLSYSFNINEGINIESFEELKAVLESSSYKGEIINIVVLEKPTTDAYDYEYGYDLVPAFALKAQAEQTFANVTVERLGNISIINKNVHINGNYHTVDVSQVRTFTSSEQTNLGWQSMQIDPLFTIMANTDGKAIEAKIYDLNVLGNASIDYKGDISKKHAVGAYARAFHIGCDYVNAPVYLDMNNIEIGGFDNGMRILHVVNNGVIKNIHVYNCFGNGIELQANIMTLENMNYGQCGGAGVELTPVLASNAGTSFNQNQHITFAGSIETENFTTGDTPYLNGFSAMGFTVVQIIGGVLQAYPAEAIQNVQKDGKFAFITFVFTDLDNLSPNASTYEYKNIDGAGIINIRDVQGIDTTHKYIELDVVMDGVPLPIGKVLLYNYNYQGE